MESKRKIYKLSDLVSLRNGAAIKQEYFTDDQFGIDLIKVSNFTKNSIDITGVTKVDIEHARKWVSHRIKANDILIATVGSWPPNWSSVVGKVVRAPKETQGAIQNQNTCCVIPGDLVNQNYLYYLLKTKCFSEWVVNVAQGSANQARVPVKKIGDFLFELPPIDEQVKVSKTLDALDVKITLNRQINQTLEQMAQALFKSWFVDFDYVVDNALDAGFFEQDLEFPDELLRRAEARKAVRKSADFKPLPENTRQLFPAAFEECSEPSLGLGGWVPEGWGTLTLSEISKIASGKRPPTKGPLKTKEEPVSVWGGNGIKWFTDRPLSTDRYIITGRVGTLGTVYKVNGPSWASDNALTIRPLCNEYFEFVYQVLSSFDINSLNSGSTQPLVTQTALSNIQLVFPNNAVLFWEFQKHADNYDKKTIVNSIEVEIITNLRDILLPKLISGELCLSDREVDTVDEVLG